MASHTCSIAWRYTRWKVSVAYSPSSTSTPLRCGIGNHDIAASETLAGRGAAVSPSTRRRRCARRRVPTGTMTNWYSSTRPALHRADLAMLAAAEHRRCQGPLLGLEVAHRTSRGRSLQEVRVVPCRLDRVRDATNFLGGVHAFCDGGHLLRRDRRQANTLPSSRYVLRPNSKRAALTCVAADPLGEFGILADRRAPNLCRPDHRRNSRQLRLF